MSEQNICIDAFAAPATREPISYGFGIRRILAKFHAWGENRATTRHLRSLSDRQLRDIGINRFDLPPEVQDALIAGRDTHALLDMFPHTVIAGVSAHRRRIRD